MLAFQKLDVYRRSAEFLALSAQISKAVPRGNADLLDQLRRAATSVSLNIAEASGRTSAADMARAYAIARGSATECVAVLDALHILELIDATSHQRGINLLERVVAMLSKMCR